MSYFNNPYIYYMLWHSILFSLFATAGAVCSKCHGMATQVWRTMLTVSSRRRLRKHVSIQTTRTHRHAFTVSLSRLLLKTNASDPKCPIRPDILTKPVALVQFRKFRDAILSANVKFPSRPADQSAHYSVGFQRSGHRKGLHRLTKG